MQRVNQETELDNNLVSQLLREQAGILCIKNYITAVSIVLAKLVAVVR
jgi:hypothetical protein